MDLRVDWDVQPRESGRSSPDVPGKQGYKRMQGDAMHTLGNEPLRIGSLSVDHDVVVA